MSLPGHAAPVLVSLVREDLQSIPGPVLAAAEAALTHQPRDAQAQLDACLAAFAAGEPKRALQLLAPTLQGPRVTAALTAWARQLDGNWYPGDVGAESQLDPDGAFVEAHPGEATEELLEQIVRHGPTGLLTPRTLLEGSLRNDAIQGAQQAVALAWGNLDTLSQYATARGWTPLAAWAVLAAADVTRRAGMAESEQLLATARSQLSAAGDGGRLALTYLVEGDWYAAPGSSPEALGWDLAPQPRPSAVQPDPQRAAACYDQADVLLGTLEVPRLRAALALRRAMLARTTGDHAARREHLDAALAGSRAAGDAAGYHLAAMHGVIADIDEGLLGKHALDLGGGWHRPSQGPIAETLGWAETVGSRSWCVGLGRLLQRCGEQWADQGSATRSRIALLGALALISADPTVPSQTLVTAVAHADGRNNLATNALLRLERAFGPMFADTASTDGFGFAQKLEASIVLVSALRDRARGSTARLAAERLTALGQQLAQAADSLRASLPPVDGPVPTTMDELQAALVAMQGDGSLTALAARAEDGFVLMQHMQLAVTQRNIDMTDVLASLAFATAAQGAGMTAEAGRWSAKAVEVANRPGVDAYLLPLALVFADRYDEARAAMLERAAEIPDEFQLTLWLRAKDNDKATETLSRMEAAGFVPRSWQDLLAVAELRLGRGEYDEARTRTQQAIAAFEDSVRLLLRDPERLDACNQPDVAALFTTLALTYLPPDRDVTAADADASFQAAELARSLSTDSGLGSVDAAAVQTWRRSAAEYAAVANSLLARLASATPEEQAAGFAALDDVDASLTAAEHALDTQDPGILLRRTTSPPPPSGSDLRGRLGERTVLLEYLAVGDDLLAWAVTREAVRPLRQRIRLRELAQLVRVFHTACADGRAPDSELSRLLVEPFADLLREHDRVVVVPFGPLHLVPFHALPFDGAPLALSHVVSYAPSAMSVGHQDIQDRPVAAQHPLVVGDPAFDTAAHPTLKPLPGSRAEAAAVAAALGAPTESVLVGSAATESAVGDRLEACDLLHVSSHGHLDELSPFASSLVLAGQDELTVADIAGLRFGTDLAVLTGCDTGRGNATLGGDVVGLTRSLLRSGVERAVVSLWPVDDWVAPVVMSYFYTGMAAGLAPAYALTDAQRKVHASSVERMREEYAGLGGDPVGNANLRRGFDLDPDLRDEEEIPEPLAGNAERYWAPFVLVG